MPVEVDATIAALDRMLAAVRENTSRAVGAGADRTQQLGRTFAPHLSGELAGSITVTGPYATGAAEYTAKVGPTMVYGRIREIGGRIPGRRTVMTHPFLRWSWNGHWVFKHSVDQSGAKYMLRAVETMRPLFRGTCASYWADALKTT